MSSTTPPSSPPEGAPLALVRVPFRGGHLLAAQLEGEVWVPIRPVCDALGLAWQPQLTKLRAKPWATVTLMVSVAGDGKARQLAAVDLRSLPLWLATIEPARVKPEAREALVAYQREAAEILFKHFLAPSAPGAVDVGAQLAELSARVELQGAALAATRKELSTLRPGLRRGLPQGPLLPDGANEKIAAYCASRPVVTSKEILTAALGCTAWNHAATMAVALSLRSLGYVRRRVYNPLLPCGRAYLYERPQRAPAATLPKREGKPEGSRPLPLLAARGRGARGTGEGRQGGQA